METIELDPTVNSTEVRPPVNVNAPIEPLDIRLNFNCMLYLFTELMALFNELIKTLHEKEQVTEDDIRRIFAITADKDTLMQTYQPVFNRFMEYYVLTKQDVTGKVVETTGPKFGARDENSVPGPNPATEVKSTVGTASINVVQEPVEDN